jgi:hypothetical protein
LSKEEQKHTRTDARPIKIGIAPLYAAVAYAYSPRIVGVAVVAP